MISVYQYIEFILLTILLVRIAIVYRKGLRIDSKYVDILLFYFTWYIHSIITWLVPSTTLSFHFVHCTFPIVISGTILFKSRSLFYPLSIIILILINLYFHHRYLIDFTYLLTYLLILKRIYKLYSLSRKNRRFIPMYGVMLITLIVTHLIFLFGKVELDWNKSLYAAQFIYSTIIIYLVSLTLIHVQFRRFLAY